MTTQRLDAVSMGEVFAFAAGGCRYRKLTRAGERVNRYRLVEPVAGMFYVSDMPHEMTIAP
jgi:hypothetical protein